MDKISIHQGSLTFSIDKKSLSKSLGVFQTNGMLESTTTYRLKSIVQTNVLKDFLIAAKLNVLPKITKENRSQMNELSKEFDYHDLKIYISQNENKTNQQKRIRKIPKNNQKSDNEQIKSISEEKVIEKRTNNLNENDNELSKTSLSSYESYSSSSTYDYSSSSSFYDDYESDSNVEFDFSDDDENKKLKENQEKKKKTKTSNNKPKKVIKQKKIKPKKILEKKIEETKSESEVKSEETKLESEVKIIENLVVVDEKMNQKEHKIESEPTMLSNTTESSSEVLSANKTNSGLTPIKIMALNLQRALFGDSSTDEHSSSSLSLMQENSENESTENASFKNRIIQLEYILFGHRPNDGIDHHLNGRNFINSSQELDRVDLPALNLQPKRQPRHTNRHLPSALLND